MTRKKTIFFRLVGKIPLRIDLDTESSFFMANRITKLYNLYYSRTGNSYCSFWYSYFWLLFHLYSLLKRALRLNHNYMNYSKPSIWDFKFKQNREEMDTKQHKYCKQIHIAYRTHQKHQLYKQQQRHLYHCINKIQGIDRLYRLIQNKILPNHGLGPLKQAHADNLKFTSLWTPFKSWKFTV